MWSLTSLRTKRISSFRKFRLLPPKDFFDSIDPKRTLVHLGNLGRPAMKYLDDLKLFRILFSALTSPCGASLIGRNVLRAVEQVCRIEPVFRLAQSRIQLLSVGSAHACVTLILGHEVGVANACRKRVSCTPEFARPSDVLLVFVRCLPSGRNV